MTRPKIALIGGGQVGGNIALLSAQKELGDLVIVDIPEAENFMKGKALDISQLLPHDGYDSKLIGTSSFEDIKNSDVVVITAGFPRQPGMDREDLLQKNLNIMSNVASQVKKYAPKAFVIVVSNPLDAMVYAFYKISEFPKNRVVGMAGALDSARFRAFIAEATNLSSQDVNCMVLGGHGDTMVPVSRLATVGGVPLSSLLSKKEIIAIEDRTRVGGGEIVKLFGKGSAFYAPAQSTVEMIESFVRDKKRVIPCASLCEGEFDIDGYFIGVPTVIGSEGVEKILTFDLDEDEKSALKNTLAEVKKTVSETGL
tara:strand:+ start:649 stop:1584 length:936 start_codon:yes stop_codon:yes gene_type:complete